VSSQYNISIRLAQVLLKSVDFCTGSPASLPPMMKIKDRNVFATSSLANSVLPLHTQKATIA
jgi:hypothetical protein